MLKDFQNPLRSEILDRRKILKERILGLIDNPESIKEEREVLFVERYGDYLAFYIYSPAQNRNYQTVAIDCNLTERSRHLVFCYERNWEEEGYNQSTPVIEMKDGRQIECGILNLENLKDEEKRKIEVGFNEIQRIIAEENATILQ